MFVSLKDLRGLNTTEVSYPGAPSVEEQMTMFHSGPLDVAPETVETTKEAGHKQQAITSGWDSGLGQTPAAASQSAQAPNRSWWKIALAGGAALGVAALAVRCASGRRLAMNPSLTRTVNNKTGAKRYYIDGKRVTRDQYDAAKSGRRLDTFHTVTRGGLTRHHCEARTS